MTEALSREFQICEEIGRGRFGIVHRCVSLVSSEVFAVKSIDKRKLAGDSLDSLCLFNEPKILSLVSPHPNVTQIYQLYEEDSHLHMVLDLCHGDLYTRIVDEGAIAEAEARPIMAQLMHAVSHIHRLGVVHRDIKPDNVLFDSRNAVKLADFGSAEVLKEGEAELRGVVGTPYYVAPEVLAGRGYGSKVDVWSAGVIMYIMLAGFPPFYGETAGEIFEAVLRGNLRFPIRVFQSISPMAKDLLRRMLCKDVSRRFTAEQVLRHPWMTSMG